jgi:hypothetical protein
VTRRDEWVNACASNGNSNYWFHFAVFTSFIRKRSDIHRAWEKRFCTEAGALRNR